MSERHVSVTGCRSDVPQENLMFCKSWSRSGRARASGGRWRPCLARVNAWELDRHRVVKLGAFDGREAELAVDERAREIPQLDHDKRSEVESATREGDDAGHCRRAPRGRRRDQEARIGREIDAICARAQAREGEARPGAHGTVGSDQTREVHHAGTGRALRAGRSLWTLRALRTGRSLRTSGSCRTGGANSPNTAGRSGGTRGSLAAEHTPRSLASGGSPCPGSDLIRR